MRILIVSQYFWPEDFRINDLALGLLEKGHQVTVLTGLPNYPEGKILEGYGLFNNSKQEYRGVKIVRVPLIPRGKGGGLRLILNYFSYVATALFLGPLRCRGKFDLIFVFAPSPITVALPGILFKYLKSAPMLMWVQDLWPESVAATGAIRNPKLLKLVGYLVSFIYRFTDRILVTSKSFAPSMISLGADPERILYFPQTAEDFYQPATLEPIEEMPNGFKVMFAGNIGVAQDFETILKAAEQLRDTPNIKWVVLGGGRMKSWVENQIRERNLSNSVLLLGRFPATSMPKFFAHADAMLVTLKKDPLFAVTIPAKIQSYMACAKPIVAAIDGEGAQIIAEADAGLAVNSGDHDGLAKAVRSLYEMDRANRQQLGINGRNYFNQHFDRKVLFNRLNEWIIQKGSYAHTDSRRRRDARPSTAQAPESASRSTSHPER